MKLNLIILSLCISPIFSFNSQEESGKELFLKNCASCHKPDKEFVGPPFQNIREDYGLSWTLQFIKNGNGLIKGNNPKAIYVFKKHSNMLHPSYKFLNNKSIINILQYVDSFPIDSSLYVHRKLTDSERLKAVGYFNKPSQKRSSTKRNSKNGT